MGGRGGTERRSKRKDEERGRLISVSMGLYLDQLNRLEVVARMAHVPVTEVVRQALDLVLPHVSSARVGAIQLSLPAPTENTPDAPLPQDPRRRREGDREIGAGD